MIEQFEINEFVSDFHKCVKEVLTDPEFSLEGLRMLTFLVKDKEGETHTIGVKLENSMLGLIKGFMTREMVQEEFEKVLCVCENFYHPKDKMMYFKFMTINGEDIGDQKYKVIEPEYKVDENGELITNLEFERV